MFGRGTFQRWLSWRFGSEFFGPIHIGSLKNVDFQYFSIISQHSSCLFLHQLKWERLNTFCQKLKFQVFSTPISSGILVSKFCISLHACKFVCLLCLLIFFCCVDCRFFYPVWSPYLYHIIIPSHINRIIYLIQDRFTIFCLNFFQCFKYETLKVAFRVILFT